MRIERIGLDEKVSRAIIAGVSRGEFNLLVGAGFSCSAEGGDGVSLPLARDLAGDLCREFSLDLSGTEEKNLSLVFDEAKHKDEMALSAYLKKRFSNCKPNWQDEVLCLPWRRIWSLNIDDVLEQSWTDGEERFARPQYFLPTSRYSSLAAPSAGAQIVYLHGRARSLGSDVTGLTFDVLQYASATELVSPWRAEFWTEWMQRPFISVGARLEDETDLAHAVHGGSFSLKSTGMPSLLVLHDVSDAQRSRHARRGVISVKCDAEEFFAALLHDVLEYRKANPLMASGPVDRGHLAMFNRQFEALSLDVDRWDRESDFYGGDEPTWSDIVRDLDAPIDRVADGTNWLFGLVGSHLSQRTPKVLFFTGSPGCGKSTALLRAARVGVSEAAIAFSFRGEERPDVDALLGWLATSERTFLIFDSCADYVQDIRELLLRAESSGVNVRVAVADRERRRRGVESDLFDLEVRAVDLSAVRKADVSSLMSSRDKFGRSGELSGASPDECEDFFIRRHSRSLFSALSALEGGSGFRARMDNQLRAIAGKDDLKAIISLIATVHSLGYAVPVRVISTCLGISPASLADLCAANGALFDILVVERNGVRLRHRTLAEYYATSWINGEGRAKAIVAVVKSLAPLITPETISQRTYAYLIVRALLEHTSVMEMAGDVEIARRVFDQVEREYSWNGRYWDQRALMESRLGVHDVAYSYAKRSVITTRHAFSYNTLGTVRVRAAVDERSPLDASTRWEYFLEGIDALRESVQVGRERSLGVNEHPFETFFVYSIRLLKHIGLRDPRRNAIALAWATWEELADPLVKDNVHWREKLKGWRNDYSRALVALN